MKTKNFKVIQKGQAILEEFGYEHCEARILYIRRMIEIVMLKDLELNYANLCQN